MKKILLAMMLVVSLVAVGCSSVTEMVGGGKNAMEDPATITKIVDSLKNRDELKGKDFYLFQDVNFSYSKDIGNVISFNVLKPGTEDIVDRYLYRRGTWEVNPVKITGKGDMKDNITPIKGINFDVLPTVVKDAKERAKDIEGADISWSAMKFRMNGSHEWWVKIKGTRKDAMATYSLDGSFKSFK